MSAIRYNNQRIIPAPFVGISKSYQKQGQEKIGSIFSINLQGKLLPCKGSPTSSGTFYDDRDENGVTRPSLYPEDDITVINRLSSFATKEKAVRQLFATEGLRLEIEPRDSATAEVALTPSGFMYCFPRINAINFAEGNWTDAVEYTIDLECDEIFGFPGAGLDAEDAYRTPATSGDYFVDAVGNKLYLESATEDWALEFNDTPQTLNSHHTFRLSHNVSAIGKKAYDANGLVSEGWKQARRWVNPRLGLNTEFLQSTSGLNLNGDMNAYNHSRSETTDELGGSYAISETWIVSSGDALTGLPVFEDFTVNINTSRDTSDTTSVTVDGLITGLDRRDTDFNVTYTKWTAASGHFHAINPTVILDRAKNYSGTGTTLNTSPLSTTIGQNISAGTITYNFTYDTRPTTCITGALRESIIVTDTNSHDVFATIPVIGRAAGPILQGLGSTTESTRNVAIDITVAHDDTCPSNAVNAAAYMAASPKVAVATIVDAFRADLNTHDDVFKNGDSETWDAWNGKYTRNVGWTYQSCSD